MAKEWDFKQMASVASGVIGSILSASAFSNERAISKGRIQGGSKAFSEMKKNPTRIVQQLGGSILDAEAASPLFSLGPVPRCTAASDLRRPGRHFTIITTAALPWLTGTAVNPLLRALALAKQGRPTVFVMPWLGEEDQKKLFPNGQSFATPADQEKLIKTWCTERAKMDADTLPLEFRWYTAKYVSAVRSIFPKGDCSMSLREEDPRDVLILEEPEHLCWYHHGQRWPELFEHVIGIVHTNYQDYLVTHKGADGWDKTIELVPAEIKEASVFAATTVVCSAYCDVNIKLSDTIMPLPNEVTCNVHGVRDEFLQVGDGMTGAWQSEERPKAYYLGKALYEKGWEELLDLLKEVGSELEGVVIDGYGSGPDYENIIARSAALDDRSGKITMHPGLDHANEVIHQYGVLVNPSTSDVLCTVTVEALAMGKRCVLAKHPSNRFFENRFPNRCHFFKVGDGKGFAQAVRDAIAAGPPVTLPEEQRFDLTWEAGTERLFESAEVRVLSGPYQRPSEAASSRLAYQLHYDMMRDRSVLADLIKEATIGEQTPWDEYFEMWRRNNLAALRKRAKEVKKAANPKHLQEHEIYLKERLEELTMKLKTASSSSTEKKESQAEEKVSS